MREKVMGSTEGLFFLSLYEVPLGKQLPMNT